MIVAESPVFWLLMAMAIIATFVFFERLLEFRRSQIDYQDFIKGVVNVLNRGNRDEALSNCDEVSSPVANVFATAIHHQSDGIENLQMVVTSRVRTECARMNRKLASLLIIAQTAPMVGLLGTVIGFIRTVLSINSEVVVARTDLFVPMMGALTSAAMGLSVAIPTAVMYGILKVRLNRIASDLDAAGCEIVGHLTRGGCLKK